MVCSHRNIDRAKPQFVMQAEAFTPNHSACPLCARSLHLGRLQGRLICPCCHSRLVVSMGGQFVRDPFSGQRSVSTQKLRRQSSPIARFGRDVQAPVKLLLGGLLLCTIVGTAWVKLAGHTGTNPLDPATMLSPEHIPHCCKAPIPPG